MANEKEQSADTIGIEDVACNLCGAENSKLLYHAPVAPHRIGIYNRDIWNIVCCQRCGLIYVNPRVDNAARESFYTFQTPGDNQFVHDWFLDNADLQQFVWKRFLRTMQRYIVTGKLLDIGCGAGSFLIEAQKVGYEAVGQEISPFFVEYCRTQHNLTIYNNFLEDLRLQLGSFDCVTAFDVIEHHPNPTQLVIQIRQLLRPGGLAVISTHDIGNFYARLYGVKWRYIRPIGHITYFTRQTLTRLLTQNGFHILQVGGIHTIDATPFKERRNRLVQFFKVIVLRALIIALYKPITDRIPTLTKWQVKLGQATLDHNKLLVRAGNQIIMDDDMVVLAKAI